MKQSDHLPRFLQRLPVPAATQERLADLGTENPLEQAARRGTELSEPSDEPKQIFTRILTRAGSPASEPCKKVLQIGLSPTIPITVNDAGTVLPASATTSAAICPDTSAAVLPVPLCPVS